MGTAVSVSSSRTNTDHSNSFLILDNGKKNGILTLAQSRPSSGPPDIPYLKNRRASVTKIISYSRPKLVEYTNEKPNESNDSVKNIPSSDDVSNINCNLNSFQELTEDSASFHGDIQLNGKPFLCSLVVSNMDEMLVFVSDYSTKFYIYETSYQRYLQRFFASDYSCIAQYVPLWHRRMIDMFALAFNMGSYTVVNDSSSGTSLKMNMSLKYPPEEIDKTVVFRLFSHEPNRGDLSSQMVYNAFCKLVTSLFGYYQNYSKQVNKFSNGFTNIFALATDCDTIGGQDDLSTHSKPMDNPIEEDIRVEVNTAPKPKDKSGEVVVEEIESINEHNEEIESINGERNEETTSVTPVEVLNENSEISYIFENSLPTTDVVLFLKHLESTIANIDINVDRKRLAHVIHSIAKNDANDMEQDDIQHTSKEESDFFSTFLRARSEPVRSWRSLANLVRAKGLWRKSSGLSFASIVEQLSETEMFLKENISKYELDVLELNEVSKGAPLSSLVKFFLKKYELMEHFNINRESLGLFLAEVEKNYGSNPFHNSMHAADVLHTFIFILESIGMIPLLTTEELLAVILAAAMHDYNHPGTTNQFQIVTSSDIAMTYNDKSVLESHHLSSFFKLLSNDKFNILKNLPTKQFRYIRELVIGLISATDLSFQPQFLSQFQALLDVNHGVIDKKQEKTLILKMALKLADTSNTSKPLQLHLPWITRLQTEFFMQGEREKNMNMDISMFMDREKSNISKCQCSFIEYVTFPFVSLFTKAFKEVEIIATTAKEIKAYWAEHTSVQTVEDVNNIIRQVFEEKGLNLTPSHIFEPKKQD